LAWRNNDAGSCEEDMEGPTKAISELPDELQADTKTLDRAVKQVLLAKLTTVDSDGVGGSCLKKLIEDAKKTQYFNTLTASLPVLENKVRISIQCERWLQTCTQGPFSVRVNPQD